MIGGTYRRALEAGFSTDQAMFFSNLASDTHDEALESLSEEIRSIQQERKIPKLLRKLADRLDG